MDVLNEILQHTALNGMSKWYRATTLLIFSTIVVTLAIMLVVLLIEGPTMTIHFGY